MQQVPAVRLDERGKHATGAHWPVCLLLLLTMAVGGCSNQPEVTLAGGKPLSQWIEALRDKDPKTRKAAATHIGNAAASDPAAVSALIDVLKDPDPNVRCEVLLALMKCGSAASDAIPKIADMQQKDPSEKVRTYAAEALKKIRAGN